MRLNALNSQTKKIIIKSEVMVFILNGKHKKRARAGHRGASPGWKRKNHLDSGIIIIHV